MSTACAVAAEGVPLLAFVGVLNAVLVPWLLVALLARDVRNQARLVQDQGLVQHQSRNSTHSRSPQSSQGNPSPRRPSPLTMHAAVCSALGGPQRRRPPTLSGPFSLSDSALLGNEKTRPTSRGTQTSPSSPTPRTSPVFARMLANTREPPATPCIRRA